MGKCLTDIRSLPLTAVFAPATLSVTRSSLSNSSAIEVPTIGISNSSLYQNFVYTVRTGNFPSQGSSRLGRIIGAVAMSGQRENLQSPTLQPNASYTLQAYAPLLRCSSANATVQSQLITMLMDLSNFSNHASNGFGAEGPLTPQDFNNETFHWDETPDLPGDSPDDPDFAHGDIGYFGVLPVWEVPYAGPNNTDEGTLYPWWNSSQILSDPSIADYGLTSLEGEIWIAIPTTSSDNSSQTPMEFINCHLCNSSLTVNVEFINQVSNITVIENKWMNDLHSPPFEAVTYGGYNNCTELYSYFGYLYEIGTYLLGFESWWVDANGTPVTNEDAEILNTHLATSSQVYYMDNKIQLLSNKTTQTAAPDQVRNISFMQDIEDFALNSTLSLLSDTTLW
jgi:hypothetical protein